MRRRDRFLKVGNPRRSVGVAANQRLTYRSERPVGRDGVEVVLLHCVYEHSVAADDFVVLRDGQGFVIGSTRDPLCVTDQNQIFDVRWVGRKRCEIPHRVIDCGAR